MDLSKELERFPRTGRFLANRMRDSMSEEEKEVLESIVEEVETISGSRRIIEKGKEYTYSTMLIDGFMLRTLDAPDRRHAVSCHVAGDFIDLHCFALKRLDHNIDGIGDVTVGYVPHQRINEVMDRHPHLARLFWFSTLLDAAMHREWIKSLEKLNVPQRIAHIVSEIWFRLRLVGLESSDGFQTPLRQTDLAQMCGASDIHTNRAIKLLSNEGLMSWQRGRITVPDRQALHEYCEFEPSYLYPNGVNM